MFAVVLALAFAGSAIAQPSMAPLPSMSSAAPMPSMSSAAPTEADVLTFAFNLECLEGQFYSCAAYGTPLPTAITGNGPAPSSEHFSFQLVPACLVKTCLGQAALLFSR